MWGKDIKQPYDFISNYTEETYEYLIEEIFDKDEEIKGYKQSKGNPSKTDKKGIASEIYSFFGTHYYKMIEAILRIERNDREILYNDINIIDIGANIGTATFAYLDLLNIKLKSINININIVFVEPDKNRVYFLEEAINKYMELSKFNIKYNIIPFKFEMAEETIISKLDNNSTVVLVSNVMNWPSDINIFKEKLIKIIKDNNFATYIVNVESQYENAQKRFIEIYDSIVSSKLDVESNCIKVPKFRNTRLNYFRDRFNKDIYIRGGNFYYGHIIKHPIVIDSTSIDNIKRAYYKSIYTIKNYFIYDSIELKYISKNIDEVAIYIKKFIENDLIVDNYNCQYDIKKSSNQYRSMYLDDMINDIIYTSIIITKGIKIDKFQNNEISFGNRVDEDRDSPFVFMPYYKQYFEKFMKKGDEYRKKYSNYYKIDIKSYYNNIDHNLLSQKIENNHIECKWYTDMINLYISRLLRACKDDKGISQGSDFSHLLANIYLQEFDNWFDKNFNDASMIRYVDDITIFSNSKQRCLEIKKECCQYLEDKLLVYINEDKNEFGTTDRLYEDNNDKYFNDISRKSYYILKCLYKLDSKNYNYYKQDTNTFLKVYQQCLARIGISISLEWLRIKLEKEESFLEKIKFKIINDTKRDGWLRKKVYKFNVDLGEIPLELDVKKIDIWEEEFKKRRKNRTILKSIQNISEELELGMENIINEIKLNKKNKKLYNSLFKFTLKKLATFRSKKLISWIEDILEYFPQCNKKMFWSYKELEDIISSLLLQENDAEKYDLYAYIWLLGEYKDIKNIAIIEEIFVDSYKKGQKFLNTAATETILKIGQCSTEFIVNITKYLISTEDYYFIRNILLILNNNDSDNFDEIINKLDRKLYDERVNLFIDWICKNKCIELIEEITLLPEEIIDKYKCYYPMEETYSRYGSP